MMEYLALKASNPSIFICLCIREIKSFTSKNPGGKTSSTGMSSIDPTKIQAASRQQNHKFAVGVKSNKHKKTKSSAMLNNSGEDCYSRGIGVFIFF